MILSGVPAQSSGLELAPPGKSGSFTSPGRPPELAGIRFGKFRTSTTAERRRLKRAFGSGGGRIGVTVARRPPDARLLTQLDDVPEQLIGFFHRGLEFIPFCVRGLELFGELLNQAGALACNRFGFLLPGLLFEELDPLGLTACRFSTRRFRN